MRQALKVYMVTVPLAELLQLFSGRAPEQPHDKSKGG